MADVHFDEGLEASALDRIAANSVESDALPTDLLTSTALSLRPPEEGRRDKELTWTLLSESR